MTSNAPSEAEKSKVSKEESIDWDKLGRRVAIVVSCLAILTFFGSVLFFLWTLHTEISSLNRDIGVLEGQVQVIIKK